MSQFLPYFIARNVARDLDTQGVQPGIVLRGIIGIGRLAVLGFVLCIVAAVADFIGWKLGLI